MASELARIRTPSPLPDDVLRHVPVQDPAALRNWLVNFNFIINSTVPINKLPVELLADIMRRAREAQLYDWPPSNLMQTCRHWYAVAITTPSLWTFISTMMPLPLLKMYLQRSGNAGLVLATTSFIDGEGPSHDLATLLQLLSPHFDRVVHLETLASQRFLDHSMARLSSVVVDGRWDDHYYWPSRDRDFGSDVGDPVRLHGDRYPRLTSLTLLESPSGAIATNMNSLVSLILDAVEFDTWSAFFGMLKSCPALVYLVIDASPAPSPFFSDVGGRVVTLQQLRELTFKHCDRDMGTPVILARLALPRIVKIAIQTLKTQGIDEQGFGGADRDMMDAVIDVPFVDLFPGDMSLPVMKAIRKVESVVKNDRLEVLATTAPEDPWSEKQTIAYSCLLEGHINPELAQRAAMLQLGTLFPPLVKILHISVHHVDSYLQPSLHQLGDGWRELYAAFPDLEELEASGADTEFFTGFLADLSQGPSSPVWPRLKRLRLEYNAVIAPSGEPDAVMYLITSTLPHRRFAASVEHLQQLDIVFSEIAPHTSTQMLVDRLRGVATKIVCIFPGEQIVLDDGTPLNVRETIIRTVLGSTPD